MAFIIKTCYGFCLTQGIAYSVEVKYIIVDINTYRKESKECTYQSFYKKNCPRNETCPIFWDASDIFKS